MGVVDTAITRRIQIRIIVYSSFLYIFFLHIRNWSATIICCILEPGLQPFLSPAYNNGFQNEKPKKTHLFLSQLLALKKKMCEKRDAIIFMAFPLLVGIGNSKTKIRVPSPHL